MGFFCEIIDDDNGDDDHPEHFEPFKQDNQTEPPTSLDELSLSNNVTILNNLIPQ
jgi:hypothetical protein